MRAPDGHARAEADGDVGLGVFTPRQNALPPNVVDVAPRVVGLLEADRCFRHPQCAQKSRSRGGVCVTFRQEGGQEWGVRTRARRQRRSGRRGRARTAARRARRRRSLRLPYARVAASSRASSSGPAAPARVGARPSARSTATADWCSRTTSPISRARPTTSSRRRSGAHHPSARRDRRHVAQRAAEVFQAGEGRVEQPSWSSRGRSTARPGRRRGSRSSCRYLDPCRRVFSQNSRVVPTIPFAAGLRSSRKTSSSNP